mmetsp:Transcript_26530/g.66502  ORF Transcript_26530/g.66502 Transcript_26530/m.66502 type:complete len:349 (-) Transcript_26530:95-1141(-)
MHAEPPVVHRIARVVDLLLGRVRSPELLIEPEQVLDRENRPQRAGRQVLVHCLLDDRSRTRLWRGAVLLEDVSPVRLALAVGDFFPPAAERAGVVRAQGGHARVGILRGVVELHPGVGRHALDAESDDARFLHDERNAIRDQTEVFAANQHVGGVLHDGEPLKALLLPQLVVPNKEVIVVQFPKYPLPIIRQLLEGGGLLAVESGVVQVRSFLVLEKDDVIEQQEQLRLDKLVVGLGRRVLLRLLLQKRGDLFFRAELLGLELEAVTPRRLEEGFLDVPPLSAKHALQNAVVHVGRGVAVHVPQTPLVQVGLGDANRGPEAAGHARQVRLGHFPDTEEAKNVVDSVLS